MLIKRSLSFDQIDNIKSLDQMILNRDKQPSLFGKGVVDVDFKTFVNGAICRQYALWQRMLKRCYYSKYHDSKPTYIGCYVCDEWLYFSNFLVWCNNNKFYKMMDFDGSVYELDKDWLVKGNNVYSPDRCEFAPRPINILIVKSNGSRGKYPIGVHYHKCSGKFIAKINENSKRVHLGLFDDVESAFISYKENKESRIFLVAEKYKEMISDRLFCAMISYKVDIFD